jgi:hypothetical protein
VCKQSKYDEKKYRGWLVLARGSLTFLVLTHGRKQGKRSAKNKLKARKKDKEKKELMGNG